MASFEEYFEFLDRLGKALGELTEIAGKKTDAVRRDDLVALDECMKREQALSLALRTMDAKREKLLSQLGLSGAPLSALAERCPAEHRAAARSAAEKLRTQYELYRSASEVSRTTLEVNLHQIEKILADAAEAPLPGDTVTDFRA